MGPIRRLFMFTLLFAVYETIAAPQDLLVSSRLSNNLLRYDSETGEFRGVFAEGPELANPNGIACGPDGNLYVGRLVIPASFRNHRRR